MASPQTSPNRIRTPIGASAPSVRRAKTSAPGAFPGLKFGPLIDALNRLPRPVLMVLTLALFVYAAIDPDGFATRMKALTAVPEPLWWMQGALITFYFGAREAFHHREATARKARPKAAPKPRDPA
jgi:hypothetical protein